MALADLPPLMQERVVCSISAAVRYNIPANIVLAVAEKEGGRPGQWIRNRNGTHDVGVLQFNTGYLAGLARYGIQPADVAAAGCFPYDLAAWRLRQHMWNDAGDLWSRAANYHSRTPYLNAIYRADLKRRALKWANWLSARYSVREVMADDLTRQSQGNGTFSDMHINPDSISQPSGLPRIGYVPRVLLRGGRN